MVYGEMDIDYSCIDASSYHVANSLANSRAHFLSNPVVPVPLSRGSGGDLKNKVANLMATPTAARRRG